MARVGYERRRGNGKMLEGRWSELRVDPFLAKAASACGLSLMSAYQPPSRFRPTYERQNHPRAKSHALFHPGRQRPPAMNHHVYFVVRPESCFTSIKPKTARRSFQISSYQWCDSLVGNKNDAVKMQHSPYHFEPHGAICFVLHRNRVPFVLSLRGWFSDTASRILRMQNSLSRTCCPRSAAIDDRRKRRCFSNGPSTSHSTI